MNTTDSSYELYNRLRDLFAEMMRNPNQDWHDQYRDFCSSVADSSTLNDELLYNLIFEKWNGIMSTGQSVLSKKLYDKLVASDEFRKEIRLFKRYPDRMHYDRLGEVWKRIARENNSPSTPLRLNRVAAAFTTDVSSTCNEADFKVALKWLQNYGLLDFSPTKNWFDDNKLLIGLLENALADSPGYDVWWRNIFVWWIAEEKAGRTLSVPESLPTPAMSHSLNTILCGPPGTSKTYYTAEHAVAIIEGKSVEDIKNEDHAEVHKRFLGYKEKGRIAFTTFHQSYGYEDFIEGIRPVLHEDDDESSSEVEYKLHTGTFKAFCRDAIEANAIGKEDDGIRPGAAVWKVSLEGTGPNETRTDCLENGYIRIGWDDYGPDITDETFKDSAYGKTVLKAFFERMQIGDIIVSCWSANETDAIGVVTGNPEWRPEFKHYKRVRKVRWLVKNIREDIRTINHGCSMVLSTVYRLKTDLTEVLSIVHKHRPQGTLRNDASPRVFVIDEINRGNISKIFGELITLIEPSKRLGAVEETKARLPYSGEDFGVPPNVYILGTMNTADRSIALLDTALRRRFDFVEMMPDPKVLHDIHVTDSDGDDTGINLETMLAVMNKRIEFLLDREHTIGHAYFLGDFEKNPTLFGLAEIFRTRIVPLLQEYFFDDYSKIRLVLGDNAKSDSAMKFFSEEGPSGVFFGNMEEAVDSESRIYRINADAFSNPGAYIGIYQLPPSSQNVGAASPSIA